MVFFLSFKAWTTSDKRRPANEDAVRDDITSVFDVRGMAVVETVILGKESGGLDPVASYSLDSICISPSDD